MDKKEKGVIGCSKCGRVIRLEKEAKGVGHGYRGRCECGQGYAMGKRLVRINGKYELPAAATVEQAKPAEKQAKGPRQRVDGKMGGLDAAAKVLREAGAPLDCHTMVERMVGQGLWSTAGRTPAATIYAAILREIAAKGEAARFCKTGRGTFALRA